MRRHARIVARFFLIVLGFFSQAGRKLVKHFMFFRQWRCDARSPLVTHSGKLFMTLLVVKLLWRRVVPFLCLLLACAAGPRGFAQTTVMFEGFEGAFPGLFWSVGDSNAANGLVYWNDVDAAFGGQAPHTGSWKGYCAGFGFGGTTANPTYQNSMTSTMARTINLAPYTRANLRFWRWVPSMGAGDSWRVSIDGTGLLNSSLTQANWTQLTFNLNSYAGSSRTLRFEFISDGATVGEGLYLDDIEVTGSTVPFAESFAGIALTNYTGYVIDADDKRRARLNCIRHLLSQLRYQDLTPKHVKLPPRQRARGYIRSPKSDQTMVPDYYVQGPVKEK